MEMVKILLFEDDKVEGKEVRDYLVEQGHTVQWVSELEECQRWLDQEIFDALILGTVLDETRMLASTLP